MTVQSTGNYGREIFDQNVQQQISWTLMRTGTDTGGLSS
jgi:hypothetical protein